MGETGGDGEASTSHTLSMEGGDVGKSSGDEVAPHVGETGPKVKDSGGGDRGGVSGSIDVCERAFMSLTLKDIVGLVGLVGLVGGGVTTDSKET